MKKNRTYGLMESIGLLKMLKMMRFTLYFLLLTLSQAFAVSTYSQQTKLSLDMKNARLEDVIDQIEKSSEFFFMYNKSMVNIDRRVDIVVEGQLVNQILDKLFENTDITYSIKDRQIMLINSHLQGESVEATSQQQKKTISGKVTDSSGSTLPGVSVAVKGTTIGVITNNDGKYNLSSIPENATLQFSFVGMKTQEIEIGKQTEINVSLQDETIGIEEVVAVGYGVQNKRDITTSISRVGGKDLKDFPVANFDQALVGKMTGVQVIQSSGKPNSGTNIRVRGTGSITAGIDPLYVVDGVPLDRGSSALEAVDMNDIESIEVLKDASSSAIYGSRGSNGVVIITTKKGMEGKTIFQYSGSYGLQQVTKKIDMLDAYQYAAFARDGHNGAYLGDVPTGNINDPSSVRPNSWDKIPPELFPYIGYKIDGTPGGTVKLDLTNTDWQDEIYQTAPITKHSLSASGGTEKSKYYLSGSYLSQNGIILNSDYQRFGSRMNYSFKTGKVKVEASFSPSLSIENRVNSDEPYANEGIVQSALAMSPTWPVLNVDGSYNYQGNGFWRRGIDYQHNEVINPVAEAMLVKNIIKHANLDGHLSVEYEFSNGLRYKLALAANYNHYYNNYYRPSTLPFYGSKYMDSPSNPTGSNSTTYYLDWLVENTLNYQKTFGKHHINAVAGLTTQKNQMETSSFTTTGAPNDLVQNVAGGNTVSGFSYNSQGWSLASVLGRVQYDYDGKYLLSATSRADGSSRFGKSHRWGYFPSLSAGWRIISEQFMKDISWISNMKLRGSYGISGNFKIGNYQQTPLLSYSTAILGQGEGSLNTGISPSQPGNDNLSWEKTAMYNAGLDVTFFRDKIGFELDLYSSNTYDLLLNVPIPTITGFSTSLQNIGKINNKGIEFSIITKNKFGAFSWNGRYNISLNRNKVLELGNNNAPIIKTAGGVSSAYFITKVGESIGSYYLLQYEGIFKSQGELDAYPHFSTTKVGDFKFIDVDGDKVMDVAKDRIIVGNYMPKFTYGFSNEFAFKNIDFSFSFQGVQGNEILNLSRRYIANMEGNINSMTIALDRYVSPENPGNGLINRGNRKSTGNNSTISTWHVEDGSYLRLQNISLGYSLPKKILGKVQNLRVYFSGQNLLTFTKYSGYNPEVNLYGSSDQLTPGVDYGSYPLSKTYSLGLNLTF